MPYIRLDQIEFSIGTQVLLDKVNLTLDKGERLGLDAGCWGLHTDFVWRIYGRYRCRVRLPYLADDGRDVCAHGLLRRGLAGHF